MITEDYVSFETAKLLKEKGFDEECWNAYTGNNWTYEPPFKNSEFNLDSEKSFFTIPTIQMAVKWLMEKKSVAIIPVLSSILDNEKFLWDIKIVVAKTSERYSQGWIYENQEDAFDTAIKYCLKNLI